MVQAWRIEKNGELTALSRSPPAALGRCISP
nr:Uncharacterised protein [Klebsiella pneumoniae]